MNNLRMLPAIGLFLLLAACTTKREGGPVLVQPAPPAVEESLIRDKIIVPGERLGPVRIGMPLRQLITAVGEPVSSSATRIPGGRPALLYRYADADASAQGAMLVLVREYDQSVYSVQVDRIEAFQSREGVRYGSSEALVRATFGKPQSVQRSEDGIFQTYCYLSGIAVRMDATGTVQSMTVFPGPDLRKICKAQ